MIVIFIVFIVIFDDLLLLLFFFILLHITVQEAYQKFSVRLNVIHSQVKNVLSILEDNRTALIQSSQTETGRAVEGKVAGEKSSPAKNTARTIYGNEHSIPAATG